MEKLRINVAKVIEGITRKDQRQVDVHRNTVDNGINEIKVFVETIRKSVVQLSMETDEDWAKGESIVQDVTECLNLLLDILKCTQDAPVIRFRQCKEVFPLTFAIVKDVSVMVCHLCHQITLRFSPDHYKKVESVVQIPEIVDVIFSFLTPETPTDLSNEAKIDSISSSEIQECRMSLHVSCIEFCDFLSKEMKPVLKSMKINNLRTSEDFKPFLVCVVRQYFYIQRVCGLARELLKCTPEGERDSEMNKYKQLFKQMRIILNHGRSIVRSLSSSDELLLDFKEEISPSCQSIKDCKRSMILYRKSGEGNLNAILKNIETACFNIGECVKLGNKCLPPGQEHVEEDISILTSSDFEEVTDSNFEDEYENYSDFDYSLTKISPRDYKEEIKDSDVEDTELIQVYKMEGFPTTTTVCLDNQGEFSWPAVGGKVRDVKAGKWIPAKHVKVEGSKVTMTIDPGDFFVVHYEFPKGKKDFSKDELSKGVSMSIPEAECSLRIPPATSTDGLTVNYKVHMTDKERIRGYKQENPEEYGNLAISEGVQVKTSSSINNSMIEFLEEEHKEKPTYVLMTSGSGGSNWVPQIIEPMANKKNLAFELKANSITHVVKVTGTQMTSKDDQPQTSFLDRVADGFLTLLGLKSKCKILTVFRIPEDDPDVIELRAECIESQRFCLNKKSDAMLDKGWLQIKDGDESSDFTIKSGGKVELVFSEKMRSSVKVLPTPEITFLRKSTCYVNVELSDPGIPIGHLEYHVGKTSVDWKRLNWNFMRERYEDARELKKKYTIDQRKQLQKQRRSEKEKMELNAVKEMERIVNEIYVQLSEEEKQSLRKEMNMGSQKTTEERFLERMTVRIKDQSSPFKYINNLLMKLGRHDLHEELMERAIL